MHTLPHLTSSVVSLFSSLRNNSAIRPILDPIPYMVYLAKSALRIPTGTNNLAHCFGCKNNLNNIDLLFILGYDFKTAVSILTRMYDQYRSRLPQSEVPNASSK